MEVQKSAEQKIHLIETRDAHLWMILLRVVNCPGLLLGFAQIELEFILADDWLDNRKSNEMVPLNKYFHSFVRDLSLSYENIY